MNYKNEDYYNYILKVDNINTPLHETYQKILQLLLKEGLDKEISIDGINTFFKLFEIRQHQLKETEIENLNNLLYFDVAFRRLIKNDNGSYSVYPSLKELPTTNDLLKYYCLGLKMDIKEIKDLLTPLINKQKEIFKSLKIENYYGHHKYLILRTKAICEATALLNNREDIEDKILVAKTLANMNTLLNEMLNALGLENNEESDLKLNRYDHELSINKNQYDFVRNCYVKVLEQEQNLLEISNRIWEKYSLKNNGVLIHQLTNGAIESNKMQKICTSFYSDNENIITNYINGNIGYAYPMNITNTFSVCEDDVGSWQVNQEQFIEKGLPENWQLDETNLWYEYPHHSKLFPPEYIEDQITKNNCFAEIIIDNRKQNVKPLYCFYTSNATEEQIKEIHYLAESQDLEVKFLMTKNENMVK